MNRLLILSILMLSGCAGAQRPSSSWEVARAAVVLADSALTALEPLVPDEQLAAEREERCREVEGECLDAVALTRESLATALDGVDDWRMAATSPTGWPTWVGTALHGLGRVLTLVKATGVAVPAWVGVAVASLSAVISLVTPLVSPLAGEECATPGVGP